jgi:hypothetical protein
MEEEEHVEYQCGEQKRRRIRELCEKTKSTMRGTLYCEENAWPACMYVDKYEAGQNEPKSDNTNVQNIGQIRLLVGKDKKIEVTTSTNRFVAHKSPLKIKNAFLHPRVKGPTHACKENNTWKPENAFNWCGIHGEENPLT